MKHRRNFLPSFLLTLLLWLAWLAFVLSYTPTTNLLIAIFYCLFVLASFFTFALIFASSRRGLLISLALTAYLILRQIHQDHLLNFILVGGLLLSIELYFRKR